MIKKVDFLGDTKREICHRIHSHFVPQSKTDESVTLSSLDLGKSKRPECLGKKGGEPMKYFLIIAHNYDVFINHNPSSSPDHIARLA